MKEWNTSKNLKMASKLTELIKSLNNEKEREVVRHAVASYKTGETYKRTQSEELRESMSVSYAEFILNRHRRMSYLPEGHYLRDLRA